MFGASLLGASLKYAHDHERRRGAGGGRPGAAAQEELVNNALLYLGIVLVAALAALFAAPSFVDWGRYRATFEAEASRLLAREVRVAGPIAVTLLPVPSMRFEKVRIADPTAEFGEPLLRAEVFTLRLAVPPLLKGAIEATRIDIEQPTVRLVQDGKGGGNWQAIATTTGPKLPFAAGDVSLGDVRVNRGTVTLYGADGNERGRVQGITGELSAATLLGPWRVRADLEVGDVRRELRLATILPDADGKVRFKATMTIAGQATTWTLDGVATDPLGQPSLEGELSARLPLSTAAATGGSDARAAGTRVPLAELKARAKADSREFAIEDLALAFEADAQPQVLGGTIRGTWQSGLELEARLAAQWLDLDRIGGDDARRYGGAGGVGVLASAHGALDRLLRFFPEAGGGRYAVSIEQASLGKEVVSGVQVEVVRRAGGLGLERLEAGLPGGARFAAAGTLALGRSLRFDGDVRLYGASLPRLLGWAARGVPLPEIGGPGPFSLIAATSLDERTVALRSARLEAAGSFVRGSLVYTAGSSRSLSVELDADAVDLPRLGVATFDRSQAMNALRALVGAGFGFDARLRVASLTTGAHRLDDVALRANLGGDALTLTSLAFALGDGTRFTAEGQLNDVAGNPRGRIRGHTHVASAVGRNAIGALLGVSGPVQALEETAGVRLPVGYAGTVHVGTRAAGALDIRLDARHAAGRLELDLAADGGSEGWHGRPLDLRLALTGASARAWLTAVPDAGAAEPAEGAASNAAAATVPARVLLEARGPDAARLAFLAVAEAPEGRFTLTGQASVPGPGTPPAAAAPAAAGASAVSTTEAVDGGWLARRLRGSRASGRLAADVRDAAVFARLAGLVPPASLVGAPFAGRLDLEWRDRRIGVEGYDLAFAGRRIGGRLEIERDADGAGAKLAGSLEVDRLSLIALAPSGSATSGGPPRADGNVWSDTQLDLASLGNVRGALDIAAGRLEIAPGLDLTGATFSLALAADTIAVEKLAAPVIGGRLEGRLALARAPAGVEFSLQLALARGRLDALVGATGGKPVASGEIDLRVDMQGRALSFRGLAGAVKGKGSLALRNAVLDRLAPTAIAMVAENVLSGKIAIRTEAPGADDATAAAGSPVVAALYGELGRGRVELGSRRVAITVADGVLAVERFTAPATSGSVEVTTRLDLASLVADSDWRLDLRLVGAREGVAPKQLPPVTVGFVGPLGQWSQLRTRIDAGAFERELVVMRMEREVQELERLRREDETRAAEEAERQRARETLPSGEPAPAPGAAPEGGVPSPPAPTPAIRPGWAPAPQLVAPPRPALGPGRSEAPPASGQGAPSVPIPRAASTPPSASPPRLVVPLFAPVDQHLPPVPGAAPPPPPNSDPTSAAAVSEPAAAETSPPQKRLPTVVGKSVPRAAPAPAVPVWPGPIFAPSGQP
jgi:uncharacterized protein involved in outer membrane biogenesis